MDDKLTPTIVTQNNENIELSSISCGNEHTISLKLMDQL